VKDIVQVVEEIESGEVTVNVGKNVIIHGVDIIKQIVQLVEDSKAQNWHGIGDDLGSIVRDLLIKMRAKKF